MPGSKGAGGPTYRFLECTVDQYMTREVVSVTRTVNSARAGGPVREG